MDALIFALAVSLILFIVIFAIRCLWAERARVLTCADAAEGAGLKLEPDTYCDDAFSLLNAMKVYALPVVVGRRFLGFFARTDVLKCGGLDVGSTYVGAVMTRASDCIYVQSDSRLDYARRKLRTSPYVLLPVLDRKQRLLGFITEESIDRVRGRALTRV